MTGKRQTKQLGLSSLTQEERVESVMAASEYESPTGTELMMEEIFERENLLKALKKVRSNAGSPGIDGMTVGELSGYLRRCWPSIREQLFAEKYEPKPVKRVEIPKPSGGVRKLGIPCVLDRFIQQAIQQSLQKRWDRTFSELSFGFRPDRSAHQAVAQAQQYIAEGYDHAVDLDLEKYFDRVNHDLLMARIAKRIADKRLLRLIRSYLKAGVLAGGLVRATDEGVPQGGPLSPLLSNLYLDDFDRELERRGHRFVRYADDCTVYVRSERSGQRVMASVKRYLEKKLKLRLNEKKSRVVPVRQSKLLGFRFYLRQGVPKRAVSFPSVERFKARVRGLTQRSSGRSFLSIIGQLTTYLRGWCGYYGFSEQKGLFRDLNAWIRRRLRSYLWEQWKTPRRRYEALLRLGLKRYEAMGLVKAGRNHGPWKMSRNTAIHMVLSIRFFRAQGLFELAGT